MSTVTAEKQSVIKVIIVEDFKLTRVGLRYALNENTDIQVVAEFENAIDGIKYVEHYKPDIVIMDLGLPNMNGIEATVKIKEISPNTHVIALTSHDRSEEVIATLSSGASAYCLKDIDPKKLANVIRDVSTGVCWIDSLVAENALNSLPKVEDTSILPSKNSSESRVPLTEREYEVLKHLVSGKSNTEIAKELIVSVHTAKAHVCSILQKMCVNDRVQAAVKAVKEGMV
ncbi:response regulator transcription factor [bacterium]|nr:response regulator transcription factor [bacterium]